MANVLFNRGKRRLVSGGADWAGAADGTFRWLLLETAVASPNPDLNFVSELVDGVNNIEMVATNYARVNATSRTVTEDDANDRVVFGCANPVFANLGVADGSDGTVRAAVLYERVGVDDATPADDHLIGFYDVAGTITNGQNFTLTVPASGVVTAT